MQLWRNRTERAARNIVLLGLLCSMAAFAAAQQQNASAELPDSPGTTVATSQPLAFPQSAAQESPTPSVPGSPQDQKASPPQSQAQPVQQKPVGIAAAEPTHAGGIAASQPAGVAVAPAKQRRTRTIVIRTAAIIGAAVAVGTVVGLTEATGSKPPGAH